METGTIIIDQNNLNWEKKVSELAKIEHSKFSRNKADVGVDINRWYGVISESGKLRK